MKKGQLLGQPFVYIFYVVVAALILIFGIKIISDFNQTSEEAEVVTFVNDFKGKVSEVFYDNKDSVVSLETLRVPKDIKEVCVLDRERNPDFSYVVDPDFKTKLEMGVGASTDNLFLFGEFKKGSVKSYKIDKLFTDDANPTCSVVFGGKINMRLANKGHNVSVFTVAT